MQYFHMRGIVTCQSMSCCSSFYMNSAVGARQFTLPVQPRFITQQPAAVLPITIYSGDQLTLYLPAVLVYALHYKYHAFTLTADDDEIGGLASQSQLAILPLKQSFGSTRCVNSQTLKCRYLNLNDVYIIEIFHNLLSHLVLLNNK